MNNRYGNPGFAWPLLGCFGMALSLLFLCLMPFLLVDAMRAAMERLHLHPAAALLAVIGIFVGGLFNIPVYRIEARGRTAGRCHWSLRLWRMDAHLAPHAPRHHRGGQCGRLLDSAGTRHLGSCPLVATRGAGCGRR